ncbi:MAG TPA: EamA family transporter [Gemmatimonadales bacterium]|jgi:drug/metabolite transporter (DMT)-like permease|nr:EamA family transporter [Gemmatimonadales bacterium]HVX88367.1 EamA family transporter [Gemmatimonadales bacterium]
MKTKILIAFALVYLVWGSTYLAIRVAVETIPPFLLAGTRNLVAGAVLLAVTRWWRSGPRRPSRWNGRQLWQGALVMGFLMFVLGNGILSWVETRMDSGLAALIVGCIPLFVVVIERVKWWGERRALTPQKTIGVLVGIGGLALLVAPGASGAGVRIDALAAGALLLGALGWAIGTVAGRELPHPEDKIESAAMTMLAGGALITLVAAFTGEFRAFDIGRVSAQGVLAWAYLVVFGSMITYSAYAWLVATVEASTLATYALVNPVVAVILGWALVGERLTGRMLLAAAVILLGLGLTLFGQKWGEVAVRVLPLRSLGLKKAA